MEYTQASIDALIKEYDKLLKERNSLALELRKLEKGNYYSYSLKEVVELIDIYIH